MIAQCAYRPYKNHVIDVTDMIKTGFSYNITALGELTFVRQNNGANRLMTKAGVISKSSKL